jgi:hypothetical protein
MSNNDEILTIEEYIDKRESGDTAKLTKIQSQLRHRILYVHSEVEYKLEKIISDYFMFPLKGKRIDVEALAKLQFGNMWVLGNLSFANKTRMAKKLRLINSNTSNKLTECNDIRNDFSHTNWRNIYKYTKEEIRLKTLRKLKNALDSIDTAEKIKIPQNQFENNFEEIILAKKE